MKRFVTGANPCLARAGGPVAVRGAAVLGHKGFIFFTVLLNVTLKWVVSIKNPRPSHFTVTDIEMA
jgi:hypothetical protein